MKSKKKFIFQRQNINAEKKTRADMNGRVLQPSALDIGKNIAEFGDALGSVRNFRIASEDLTSNPDGTSSVEVILEWDDNGAENYEVWASEEQ